MFTRIPSLSPNGLYLLPKMYKYLLINLSFSKIFWRKNKSWMKHKFVFSSVTVQQFAISPKVACLLSEVQSPQTWLTTALKATAGHSISTSLLTTAAKTGHSLSSMFWLLFTSEGLSPVPASPASSFLHLSLFWEDSHSQSHFGDHWRTQYQVIEIHVHWYSWGIFQICLSFKFTVYVFNFFLKFQAIFFCSRCWFLWNILIVFFILPFRTFYHTGMGIEWRSYFHQSSSK